tara:strand:- start:574 stop:750 length:177 start_codon:yes stop_codon:yes gene_type:complete
MKWVLVQNIPVNYQLTVLGDEDGRMVTFDSKQEAKDFVETIVEDDTAEIMIVPETEII